MAKRSGNVSAGPNFREGGETFAPSHKFALLTFWCIREPQFEVLSQCCSWLPNLAKFTLGWNFFCPHLSRPVIPRRPWLGKPGSGNRCNTGSVAPHYLAGLHKVLTEVPALVLAPGYGFFVASSAVGVFCLGRLSSSTVWFSFWDLWNPATLFGQLLVIWWPAAMLGQLTVIWRPC